MARIRTIKPEFPHSESVGNLSRDARLCFIMLWTIADDSGRLRGASRMLASLLFPYDNDAPKLIDKWLGELEAQSCIIRYSVDDAQYIQITNWLNHQKIDRPSDSKFPGPDEGSRIVANDREGSSLDQGPRTKDQGPKEGTKDARGAEFDRFWKIYPKKEAKGDAEKAFVQACKQTDAETIIAKCSVFQWPADRKFIPLPATWLRARRWEDETANPPPAQMTAQDAWKLKAKTYAEMLEKGLSLGVSAGDQDILKMVKEGYITRDLAERRGFNLWRNS